MGINFPTGPAVGQKYPVPAVPGIPQYSWDGEKWTTVGAALGGKTPVYTDGSTAMTAGLSLVAPPLNPTDAAAKSYVDLGVRADAAQSLTAAQQIQARKNISAAPIDAAAIHGLALNGSFLLSQEFGFSAPQALANGYFADQWGITSTGAKLSGAASAGGGGVCPGFPNYGSITSGGAITLGASDTHAVFQPIEGLRLAKLRWGTANGQPLTIAFQCACSVPGTYSLVFNEPTTGANYIAQFTINAANTWEYKTVTIPAPTIGTWKIDNTLGLYVYICLAHGSTVAAAPNTWALNGFKANSTAPFAAAAATFNFTGFMALPGTIAPASDYAPNAMRDIVTELLLCKRYWQRVSAAADYNAGGSSATAASALTFDPDMRIVPTITPIAAGVLSLNAQAPTFVNNGTFAAVQIVSVAAGRTYYYGAFAANSRM